MHRELLDALVEALRGRQEVVAIWVDGSIGEGKADAYSDIDLGVAVTDGGLSGFLEVLPTIIGEACDPVLIRVAGRLLSLVTADWLRADILVRTASEVRDGVGGPVDIVYDAGISLHVLTRSTTQPTERLRPLIEEFLRYLGLLPVAAARGEWIGAYIATGAMAGMLAELMQLENGSYRIGGALRVTSRLTSEQKGELHALPPLTPDASVTATQVALARSFLPRAQRLAQTMGVEYPDRLEAAALTHLARFGITLGT